MTPTNFTPDIHAYRRAVAMKPNYSAIARKLKVSPQFVRLVFLGEKTSARVMRAIERELTKRRTAMSRIRSVAA